MSEEELYKLALNDIHKYNLLNEIFAIRDKRFPKEQQDSMLYVNGYIGIDTLNNYVNLINQLQQKENIIKEVRYWVNSTIDIIKQQPTGNDEWILEKLNSFISLLDKGE